MISLFSSFSVFANAKSTSKYHAIGYNFNTGKTTPVTQYLKFKGKSFVINAYYNDMLKVAGASNANLKRDIRFDVRVYDQNWKLIEQKNCVKAGYKYNTGWWFNDTINVKIVSYLYNYKTSVNAALGAAYVQQAFYYLTY